MSSGFSQLFLKLVKVISTVKVISGQFGPLKIDSLVSFVKGEDKIVLFLKTALLLYILQLWVLGNGFDQARLGWGGLDIDKATFSLLLQAFANWAACAIWICCGVDLIWKAWMSFYIFFLFEKLGCLFLILFLFEKLECLF